jgi:DNA invertase Pin-like site-specific DNA recombinase
MILSLIHQSDPVMKQFENAIYIRVSTKEQGASGHGLNAQRTEVQSRGYEGREFVEVESGRKDDRKVLREAIDFVRATGGKLIVSKLDRLSRSVKMLFELRDAMIRDGVEVVALNLPNFDTLSVGIYAVMGQHEAELIAERTKKGLDEAKKKRGEWRKGGFSVDARERSLEARREKMRTNENLIQAKGMISTLRKKGCSLYEISRTLNESGMKTSRGANFTPMAVSRIVAGA